MEASLLFRGIDILDLWRGKLSLRRLLVLIRQTPSDDPFWLSVNAGQHRTRVSKLKERAAHYAARRSVRSEH